MMENKFRLSFVKVFTCTISDSPKHLINFLVLLAKMYIYTDVNVQKNDPQQLNWKQ